MATDKKQYFLRPYFDWAFHKVEVDPKAKMFQFFGGNHRKNGYTFYKLNEKNKELVLQYNDIHKQIEELRSKQKEIIDQMEEEPNP